MRNNRSYMRHIDDGYSSHPYTGYPQQDSLYSLYSEQSQSNGLNRPSQIGSLSNNPRHSISYHSQTQSNDLGYSDSIFRSQVAMNNNRNESFSNPQYLYGDGDRHTPTFSRRSSYGSSIPDSTSVASPYQTISGEQVVTGIDSTGSFSSDYDSFGVTRTDTSLPPPPGNASPIITQSHSDRNYSNPYSFSQSRSNYMISSSPLSSPRYQQFPSRPPGLNNRSLNTSSNYNHFNYQQPIPRLSSINDSGYGYQDMGYDRMNGRGDSSLFQTDEGYDYNGSYYPRQSIYSSDMGYGNESLYKSDTSMRNSLYGSDMNPNGSLYQSEREMDYNDYHMERRYHYNRGCPRETLYHTDFQPHMESQHVRPIPSLFPSHHSPMYRSESAVQPETSVVIDSNLNLVPSPSNEKRLESIVEIRKHGDLEGALKELMELKDEGGCSLNVYLEIIRICIDQGDYFYAEKMIEEGLEAFPKEEQLLDKLIRVEERIGHVDKILQAVKLLLENPEYRVVKSVVETCLNLCKMNRSYEAYQFFNYLIENDLFKQGNLHLSYALFLYRSISTSEAIHSLKDSLTLFPKYGPMWFALFHYLEQQLIIHWDNTSVSQRMIPSVLFHYYDEAVQAISNELRWKVYYMATQMVLRTLTQLRIVLHSNTSLLPEYHKWTPLCYKLLHYYLIHCFNCCPSHLKWKVLLLMGRVCAFEGNLRHTHQFFERSVIVTPSRNMHAMFFEISRILEYAGDVTGMRDSILAGMQMAPSEWKLGLERIHQQMKEGKYGEALALNRKIVMKNKGAGRLWASLIQIVHQVCGPDMALFVFVYSLQFVAKSGEVWCEGGRIFLNPCSSLFSVHNAQYCLNLAVYFTPQYGDSFIEAIRLYLLTSDIFLTFSTFNTYLLYQLLISRPCPAVMSRCQYSDPNYGACWFKVKIYPLSSAEEVLLRAMKYVAWDLAWHADVYRSALLREAKRKRMERLHEGCGRGDCNNDFKVHPSFRYYTFAFRPDQMVCCYEPVSSVKKMMLLFGTSQIEA